MFSVFGGLGLFGNMVSIVVLLSKDMRSNCFNNILTALNITDSLHIVFAILEVLRVDFNGIYNYFLPHSFFPYFHYPAYRICLCASIYLIMAGNRRSNEKLVSSNFSKLASSDSWQCADLTTTGRCRYGSYHCQVLWEDSELSQ